MGRKHFIIFIFIIILYFVLRFGWPSTIEFGYDQPILASLVIDFIKHPTFLDSFRYVSFNPWGFPSWGPIQIFFWVPFLLISKNPLLISQMAVIFNLLGVVFVFLTGKKFFSNKVGLIAALIYSTHPWSIIFSRMIYEPTPILTFSPIVMFFTLYFLKKGESKLIFILPILWAMIVQIYLHAASVAITGLAAILVSIKRISKIYFLFGIFLSLLLFLPFKTAEIHPQQVSEKFDQLRSEQPYSYKEIIHEYLGIMGGARLNWQVGYGYEDFIKAIPAVPIMEVVGIVFTLFLIVYGIVKKRYFLVFWTIAPLWFLISIKTPIALPRFFLVALPGFSILAALFISEVSLVPLLFCGWWIFLIINYYVFIRNFSYTSGFLSNFSDIPYLFLSDSFKQAINDNKSKGRVRISISSDVEKPLSLAQDWATRYLWNYVFKLDAQKTDGSTGYYLIDYSVERDKTDFSKIGRFGPYSVYEYNSLQVNEK